MKLLRVNYQNFLEKVAKRKQKRPTIHLILFPPRLCNKTWFSFCDPTVHGEMNKWKMKVEYRSITYFPQSSNPYSLRQDHKNRTTPQIHKSKRSCSRQKMWAESFNFAGHFDTITGQNPWKCKRNKEEKNGKKQQVPRISIASGRAPSAGRNNPPTIPGPKISNKSSLPVDKYLAAKNIK